MVTWSHSSDAGAVAAEEHTREDADDAWRDRVYDLVTVLRRHGVDADLDVTHAHDPAVDWTRYGPEAITASDFTLIAVNAAWRRAWEGSGDPTRGGGAAAEADVLKGLYNRDREDFQRRVVLVLLPGSDVADVPPGLDRLQRFEIPTFDLAGIEKLMRTLTNQPERPLVALGTVPLLPPRLDAAVSRDQPYARSAHADAAAPRTANPGPDEAASGAPGVAADATVLRDELALLDSVLRRLPSPQAGEGPHLPWSREWERIQQQRGGLIARLSALEEGAQLAHSSRPTHTSEKLALLLDRTEENLDRTNRCWLLLALAPGPRLQQQDGPSGESQRVRRHHQVAQWALRANPVEPLDLTTTVVRAPGRVVFTGEPVNGAGPAPRSTRWRLELGDEGTATMAAQVAGSVEIQPGTAFLAWQGEPGEAVMDAAVFLPVRRDRLEVWLFTALQVLTDHLQHFQPPRDTTLHLQARLTLPPRLTLPKTHNPRPLGVRMVDEDRDLDGHPTGQSTPDGAVDLPPTAPPPTGTPLMTTLATFDDPRGLVLTARRLAVELLEHFGVEDTSVLRPDGTLDPFTAAADDQQPVHQQARAAGLPVDTDGPADRRRRYDQLLTEARTQLRP